MKTFVLMMLAAATCLAAEQQQKKKDAYDIRPEAAKSADAPTSEKWQLDNKAKLAEATKTEVLAAFVKDEASAAALLAEVKPEYKTCPVKAFQIAAVTQYVMCPKQKAGRALWTAQLLAFAEKAEQPDVKMFYIDQLRWCGLKTQAAKVVEIGKASGKKCVQEFAEQVSAELSGEPLTR